jgi:mannosyltransferase OCH1-like enzyme
VQTSREKPKPYVVKMIRERSPGWQYKHYTDDDIMIFFSENPLDEFPNVVAKFFTFNYGEHRADLFRYYFLYVKGGVYIDSDAMITENIDQIVKDNDFFTVNSSYFPNTVFQGFLGASPKNELIYKALKDIYSIQKSDLLREFHILCKNLYMFIKEDTTNSKKTLFEEVFGNDDEAHVKDENNQVILIHYHTKKIIPP